MVDQTTYAGRPAPGLRWTLAIRLPVGPARVGSALDNARVVKVCR